MRVEIMANGRRGNGIPPNRPGRGRGKQPERIDSILERTTRRMGLPNMVPGSTRWKPPQRGVESEVNRILRKRLHFLLGEKEIAEIIARRKPAQKWMTETIEEFNQVDRRMPKDLQLEIKRRNSLKLRYEDSGSKLLAEMGGMARSSAQPSTLFYAKAKSFLQAQQFVFENERALAIREFVEKTRKNKGKINRAEYFSVLRYIHECSISAEITREIIETTRYLRVWTIEQFAELKQ